MTPSVGRSRLPVLRVRGQGSGHDFELAGAPPDLGIDEAINAHRAFIEGRGLQPIKLAP
jgi:hypothetical protein